jgi:hypothetical protein
MDARTVEQEIKAEAVKAGATIAAIASADAVNAVAPPGHRPEDLLPGAKSVIVAAGGQPTAGAWFAGTARTQGSIGYNRSAASAAANKIAHVLEERYGYRAMLAPSGLKAGHYPYVSLKLCAEMAGLGTRSMAGGVILNPEYGLLYYGAALTTMPLEPDGPLMDAVCPQPSCWNMWQKRGVTPCLEACPVCLSGELTDGRIGWMEFRQDLCFSRAQTTAMDAFQKMLTEAMAEPDEERRKTIVYGSHFTRTLRTIAYSSELSAQCFECLRPCPVGRKRRYALK